MSITLTAFPTAFLISPESAKNVNLTQVLNNIKDKKLKSLASDFSSLKCVRVLTNLRMGEIMNLMSAFEDVQSIGHYTYKFRSGLVVEWKYENGFCCAILSGKPTHKIVPKYAENFFKTLENIKRNNVRDINSEEFFYYNYQTAYIKSDDIVNELKFRGAKDVVKVSESEIKAYYNNQNIRYYLPADGDKFILETEQKISLVNIGIDNSLISNVEIKTNLTSEELKPLLRNFGYDYNEVTLQTPLKMSSNIIEWVLNKNGLFSAHLKNIKASHLRGEVEHLFEAMNNKTGRDVRIIDKKASFTYTYKTNYTDKGILINTLTEHGAKNLSESNDNITCELFGMDMQYSKSEEGAYNLIIERVTDKSECEGLISDLNGEYGLNIQEITYKKILERIGSQNMRLESEEVLDDNSIVLTIEI